MGKGGISCAGVLCDVWLASMWAHLGQEESSVIFCQNPVCKDRKRWEVVKEKGFWLSNAKRF